MFVEKKRNFFYLNDVIFTAGTFLKAKQSPSGWFPIPEREEKSKNQKNSSEAGWELVTIFHFSLLNQNYDYTYHPVDDYESRLANKSILSVISQGKWA